MPRQSAYVWNVSILPLIAGTSRETRQRAKARGDRMPILLLILFLILGVMAVGGIARLSIRLGGLIVNTPWLGKRTHAIGVFLFSSGYWVYYRCFIGGIAGFLA